MSHKEMFLGMVDHSILKPEVTTLEVTAEAREVAKHGVFSVCVKPCHVKAVSLALKDTDTKVGTVISFPHGNSNIRVKIAEGLEAVRDGAVELDIVANYSRFLSDEHEQALEVAEIQEFCEAIKAVDPKIVIKVIIETAFVEGERLAGVAKALSKTDVDFLKTSTGFAHTGATEESVRILRAFGGSKQVKASGGVRTADDARLFVSAGAERLGCSNTIAVASELSL